MEDPGAPRIRREVKRFGRAVPQPVRDKRRPAYPVDSDLDKGIVLWALGLEVPDMTIDKPLVTRSEDRAWGAAVFAGTRVPVDTLFEYLETGETIEEFLRQFPTVTREQAIGVLEMSRQRADREALPA